MTKQIPVPGSFDHIVRVLIETYRAHLASGSTEGVAMHAALVAAMAAYQEAMASDEVGKPSSEPSKP